MGRPPKTRKLYTFMNGREVGVLTLSTSGAVQFKYSDDWLGWVHAMPISRSIPLQEGICREPSVYFVLDNLLPDSQVIRRHVAERVGAVGTDPFSLIEKLGRDCVGALQFLPDNRGEVATGAVSVSPATEAQIASSLRNLGRDPLGMTQDNNFRISIAGAQEKTALTVVDGHWHYPVGSTPTTHILKPEIGWTQGNLDFTQSVENEWLCLEILQAFNFDVPRVFIESFEEQKVLVVERFDRQWMDDGRLLRIPQEDLCQASAMPSPQKYESAGGLCIKEIMDLLRSSDAQEKDRSDFFRAQMLYWLMAATDGHAKNYSIFLKPGDRLSLTPFYDIISVQPCIDAGQMTKPQAELALSVGGRRSLEDITFEHWMREGNKAGLNAEKVRNLGEALAAQLISVTEKVMDRLPPDFPHSLANSILGGMRRRAPLLQRS